VASFATNQPVLFFCLENTGAKGVKKVIKKTNEAKICDLRHFFKNTRYCGITCKKMAHMVKFGRK
jgi:hypothetical protein